MAIFLVRSRTFWFALHPCLRCNYTKSICCNCEFYLDRF